MLFTFVFSVKTEAASRKFKITKKYLNLPVQESEERREMSFEIKGKTEIKFVIRLANGEPDYWVFSDVSRFMGKTITVNFPEETDGFKKMYLSDTFEGEEEIYKEKYRPQFHFSSKRGWNNDPNGLVFYEGEYHLYYQHNPYESNWENMHWGHAVSKDLVHWEELTDVLHPDELGTMFSGTATVDFKNSSGFQKGNKPPIIAAYTAHKSLGEGNARQTQCIAYSNDNGRTFTKYEGNPVIDSKDTWNSSNTRDPKVFWHEPTQKWVMVLFEKNGHSFYNSDDLKEWNYLSHLNGFWECPELFELPVDGNEFNKKWVIYGAGGTYMLGDFDGHTFTPETGKLMFVSGKYFAAQTYNNIPESDGRRIQFGWGRNIDHGGDMPFTQLMLFPTELTLRSTPTGVRLFSEPVREIKKLHQKSHVWNALTQDEANDKLKTVGGELFHVKMKVEILDNTDFKFLQNGHELLNYNMNYNTLNEVFFEKDNFENNTYEFELLIDRTSIEIFAENGRFTYVDKIPATEKSTGLEFSSRRGNIKIHQLEVHELKSIW